MLIPILALLFLAAAVWLLGSWLRRKKRCSVSVTAHVSAIERNRPGRLQKETKNYYPVYTFTWNDRAWNVRPDEPSRTNQWKVGDQVALRFDPENPDLFYVGKCRSDLVWGLVSLALCVLMVVIWLTP